MRRAYRVPSDYFDRPQLPQEDVPAWERFFPTLDHICNVMRPHSRDWTPAWFLVRDRGPLRVLALLQRKEPTATAARDQLVSRGREEGR